MLNPSQMERRKGERSHQTGNRPQIKEDKIQVTEPATLIKGKE